MGNYLQDSRFPCPSTRTAVTSQVKNKSNFVYRNHKWTRRTCVLEVQHLHILDLKCLSGWTFCFQVVIVKGWEQLHECCLSKSVRPPKIPNYGETVLIYFQHYRSSRPVQYFSWLERGSYEPKVAGSKPAGPPDLQPLLFYFFKIFCLLFLSTALGF